MLAITKWGEGISFKARIKTAKRQRGRKATIIIAIILSLRDQAQVYAYAQTKANRSKH
jgi:hypothetical protein